MPFPTVDTNMCGTHVYPVTDLGLASSLPNATPVTGTAFSTGVAGTVLVLTQLSSGTCTVALATGADAASAVANLASPGTSISATTSKVYGTIETGSNAIYQMQDYSPSDSRFVAPNSQLYVAVKQTGAAGGCIFSQLVILALYELIGGEDWFSIRAGGMNAVAGVVGVGATGGPNGQSLTEPLGFQDGAGNVRLASF